MTPTLNLVSDCRHFVLAFFDVINASAQHIYVSALPLSPQTSLVRILYEPYARPSVRVLRGLPISWDPVLATLHDEDFRGVATWSPSGRTIAIAKSSTIEIIDAATLERFITLNSPQSTIHRQLWFSPDSLILTQFHRGKLTSWDLQKGILIASGEWDARLEGSFSCTYSGDGKILAILGVSSRYPPLIDMYDLLSRTHESFRSPETEARALAPIWTHGDRLRFVTLKPESITMWEAPFTSVHTPAKIGSFPIPGGAADIKGENSLFLPTLSLLAFTTRGMVLVWDTQRTKFLLEYPPTPTSRTNKVSKMSFSSDGHFFAHTTAGQEVYVWKLAPSGYILHQKLAFPPGQMDPLLSPNGESIIAAGSSTIYLWHTRNQILFSSVPAPENGGRTILGFSSDEVLAASASFGGHIVTIFDLRSGDLRLTIDAGMEVRCLGMTTDTIIVAGSKGEVVTWKLPGENCGNGKAEVHDSVRKIALDRSGVALPDSRSISPDFRRIAITGYSKTYSDTGVPESFIPRLQIHDISTGKQLAGIEVLDLPEWVVLDEREVWCTDGGASVSGWNIIEDGESGITQLEPLGPLKPTAFSPRVFPWQSRCGYEIIGGWIIGPNKERLMWLPHPWRPRENSRTWSGRFLGLGYGGLPESVILEVFE